MENNKKLPEVLETERLILRPLTLEDKDEVFKWTSDPRVAHFMRYIQYQTKDDANIWLENIYKDEKELDYGFVWKETGELIGSGGLTYNAEFQEWLIGYNIRFDMWHKGIATEASKKIIEHGRAKFNMPEIAGYFAIDNAASGHVMEKLGMTFDCFTEYSKFDNSETFKAKKYKLVFNS